jgi:hypothetical protein
VESTCGFKIQIHRAWIIAVAKKPNPNMDIVVGSDTEGSRGARTVPARTC